MKGYNNRLNSNKRLRDDLNRKAVAMYQEGQSYNRIAETLNVSKGTLSKWLRHLTAGRVSELSRHRDVAENLRDQARLLFQQGVKHKELVDTFKVDPSTMTKWLSDLSKERNIQRKLEKAQADIEAQRIKDAAREEKARLKAAKEEQRAQDRLAKKTADEEIECVSVECVICEDAFRRKKGSRRETCSPECLAILRSELAKHR